MYAVLTLGREPKLLAMGPDGRWRSDPEQFRDEFLAARREAARAEYAAAMRKREDVLEAIGRTQEARKSWEASWQARLEDFLAGCLIEPLRREPGFVRVTMPSGQTIECRRETAEELAANHLRRAEPAPTIPQIADSPTMPTDDELLEGFVASDAGQTLAWTARLTTANGEAELGSVPPDGSGRPPPSFVAEALNAAATQGWSVHHVGEDRAMINESPELVRVRYLLVAPG